MAANRTLVITTVLVSLVSFSKGLFLVNLKMSQITPDGFTFTEEIHKRNNSIFWVVAVSK